MVLGKSPVHGGELFIGHGLAPSRRQRAVSVLVSMQGTFILRGDPNARRSHLPELDFHLPSLVLAELTGLRTGEVEQSQRFA